MEISRAGGMSQPAVMSGASARRPPQQKMSQLFDMIDASGSGTITKDQFQKAFQSLEPPAKLQAVGASQLWARMDTNRTGSVSKRDFLKVMLDAIRNQGGSGQEIAPASATRTANAATAALKALGNPPERDPTAVPGGLINVLS